MSLRAGRVTGEAPGEREGAGLRRTRGRQGSERRLIGQSGRTSFRIRTTAKRRLPVVERVIAADCRQQLESPQVIGRIMIDVPWCSKYVDSGLFVDIIGTPWNIGD